MDTVNSTLALLRLTSPRARTRTLLKPFIIEAALARLGRELSPAEQEIVLRAVSDPAKVRWPNWWTVGIKQRKE